MSRTAVLPTLCQGGISIRSLQSFSLSLRRLAMTAASIALATAIPMFTGCAAMHRCSDCTKVPVTEYRAADYPEDPAPHSGQFGCYQGRHLTLVAGCDEGHFDFVFESDDPRIARVVFRDVDVSLMTPGLPEYVRGDKGLVRIALVDRQWNRQQVQFPVPGPHVEVSSGDGFEVQNLVVASLAKNCLNAGLWEVLFFVKENGKKAMYYQGWFTFPLGHYKRIWEANTGLSYCSDLNWYRMEHWLDPTCTVNEPGATCCLPAVEVMPRFCPRAVIASTSLGATSIGVWRHSRRQPSDRSNALPVRIRSCMKSSWSSSRILAGPERKRSSLNSSRALIAATRIAASVRPPASLWAAST